MIYDANAGDKGLVIDRDTGEPIPHVVWCDTDTGHYRYWEMMEQGFLLRTRRSRIIFIRRIEEWP